VPNVVEVPDVPPASRGGGALLVAAGALVPSKRPLLALAAVATLRHRGIDARLVWVGDGPLASDFDAEVARLGLGPFAERRAFCPPEAYFAVLRSADVFLLPTEFETFCVSAAEAIASGVPAVVGACGGQRDFVDDRSGVLVAGGDAVAYADAVSEMISRQGALPTADAVRDLRERFSPEVVGRQFRDAYRQAAIDPAADVP
jgi:glycosyltransferase involved in cell wall biosynthesis